MTQISDLYQSLTGGETEGLVVKNEQIITDEFLDDLAESRLQSRTERCGEYHKVASIPLAIVHQWAREGFDVYNAPAKDIVRKLRQCGYDYLFATAKNITFE